MPASYSSEFGRDLPDLSIAVLKSPALDQANKLGTLYFNPGGPGESGIEVVQYIDIPKQIRQKYDVVGLIHVVLVNLRQFDAMTPIQLTITLRPYLRPRMSKRGLLTVNGMRNLLLIARS